MEPSTIYLAHDSCVNGDTRVTTYSSGNAMRNVTTDFGHPKWPVIVVFWNYSGVVRGIMICGQLKNIESIYSCVCKDCKTVCKTNHSNSDTWIARTWGQESGRHGNISHESR